MDAHELRMTGARHAQNSPRIAWTARVYYSVDGTMPSKKKKPSASDASPRPDTPSSPTTEPAADGVILNIFDDATGPSACAVLHWETLRQLGAGLGDVLTLSSQRSSDVLLSAWASARVPPGRVGLADEVRAALGVGKGVQLRARRSGGSSASLAEAKLLELRATSVAQSEALETLGLHEGTRLSWLGAQLHGWPVSTGCVLPLRLHGSPLQLLVARALADEDDGAADAPPTILRAGARTRIVLAPANADDAAVASAPSVEASNSNNEIAGMSEIVARVREAIELPLTRRDLFTRFGVAAPTGVLLHGPPGTGKTLIARSLCKALGVHVAELSSAQLLSSVFGDAEATLARAFADARARAPSVLFLDELDALGAARDALAGGGGGSGVGSSSETQHGRLLALLLTEMDGVVSRPEPLLVLGATNRPEALDAALRRPGRFDTEIEVGVPSESGRRAIFDGLLQRTPHTLTAKEIDEAAACTAGFVGADLAALHRHAALRALGGGGSSDGADGPCRIKWSDVQAALHSVRPSALREVELRIPTVTWSDIGGQEDLKAALTEAVQWPLNHPLAFSRMGIRPPRGVLLYGPPGCSKTLAAKALAAESRTNFLAVKGPELFSKWVGESERAVAALFRRARAAAPAIIFFDEIDALAAKRSDGGGASSSEGGGGGGGSGGVGARVLAQLLHEMDGVQPLTAVLVVAATNRPDLVDPALLRPGRFDSLIHVTLPDLKGREHVLAIHTKSMPLAADVDLAALAKATEGYSGAELAALTREAALGALEESDGASAVASRHFERARTLVTPRTTFATLAYFERYAAQHKRK